MKKAGARYLSMNSPTEPRLNKLPFFLVSAVCFAVVVLIGFFAEHKFSPLPLLVAVTFLIGSITALLIPVLTDYAADSTESTRRLRDELDLQIKRAQAAGESLTRAASQIKAIEEAVHKSARDAETLPYRMQEKLAEFNEALAAKENDDREALEQELEQLRASHGEQLRAVADRIAKAAADWTALEVATRKQLTAAESALVKLQSGTGEAAATALGKMESSADAAAGKIESALGAALAKLDARLAELTAAVAAQAEASRAAALAAPVSAAPVAAVVAPEPLPLPEIPSARVDTPVPEPAAVLPEPELTPSPAPEPAPAAEAPGGTLAETALMSAAESPAPAAIEPPVAAVPEAAEPPPVSEEPPKPKKPRAPRKPKPEDPLAVIASEPAPAPEPSPAAESAPSEPEPAVAVPDESLAAETAAPEIEASASSDGATRLLATAYIGIGNRLFVRGEGPGLSWDHGVPMQFVSIGKWGWSTHDATSPIRIKLFKNDAVPAAMGEVTLEPGRHTEMTALF